MRGQEREKIYKERVIIKNKEERGKDVWRASG
jgi:hypothetical protein